MSLFSYLHRHISRTEHRRHKAAKLAQRDHERQTDGLLRIALKRQNSINSFTARDPGVFYRRREDHDQWKKHEAGGTRIGRDSKDTWR